MEMNNEVLEKIESLMESSQDKEKLLRDLVTRNSEDLFSFISLIKWQQNKGFYFGLTHSQYSDLISDTDEFIEKCQNYQFGETDSGRKFHNDFRKVLEEEMEC